MALTDVSEALVDPDFVDPIQLTRNAQTIGTDGLAGVTPNASLFYGVVTNADGDLLERGADGERIRGNIKVHTRTRLIAGAPGITADILNWRGRDYTVVSVKDYSNYGQGFFIASCDLKPLTG